MRPLLPITAVPSSYPATCRLGGWWLAITLAAAVGRGDVFHLFDDPLAEPSDPAAAVVADDRPENLLVPLVPFDPGIRLAQTFQDPAIETVDEMDARPAGSSAGSGRGPSGNWWDSIRDPAIQTVDEQTYGATKPREKEWYERINIRGYTQFRLNDVLWNDESQAPPYHPGDKSVGPFNEFFIRRCRIIFSGDLSDRLYFYIQPDFASGVPGARDDVINFTQLRDCYGDVYLTENKVNRIRVGLSKVPFGWENLQSSSNRIPLDRADPTNSAVNSERGMGVFYYWTPEPAQDLYKQVLDEGLKGSGNYGVFGFHGHLFPLPRPHHHQQRHGRA
ncbi:MAG: porin, partial [Pirellulales bacterium]